MPKTGMVMLGILGLLWLARGRNGERQESTVELPYTPVGGSGSYMPLGASDAPAGGSSGGSIASLITAALESSGQYSGGSSQVLRAPLMGPAANSALQSGNLAVEAIAVSAESVIPLQASKVTPVATEIVGPLSPYFEQQGPTISSISGEAIRQVGILAKQDSILNTANSPSVALVNMTTPAGTAPMMLEGDEPIEVLASRGGVPHVLTIAGEDQTTVVTTGINPSVESFFTTPGTFYAAVDQGYFTPQPSYVPRTWQQIESEWDIAAGLEDRHAEVESTAVVVIPEEAVTYSAAGWL